MQLIELPNVTIAIPTVNRIGYLKLALESALQQTYREVEVIVSNNLSDDGTAAYLASCTDPRLHVLEQSTRLSMTDNWNACVKAATGKYFLLLSDDDLLDPDAIRQLVNGYTLVDEPAPGIVYSGGRIIDASGNTTRIFKQSPLREPARDLILAFFQGKRDLWCCSILFRTSDLLPGYPTSYKLACDSAVWITAALRHGTAVCVPDNLVAYRQHDNLSSTATLEVWRSEYRQLYALVLREDQRSSNSDSAFARKFRTTMKGLDRALIAGRTNAEFAQRKGMALVQYVRHFAAFSSPAGLVFLGKALVFLLVSQNTQDRLRHLFRPTQ
jgi:glycosyltransferase involved in cell wall biosynthesis